MIMSLFKDKKFFMGLFSIAIPIILQFLLNSSLNFIDVFMIGQLGENEVAAVGIGNQIYFVFMMIIFGLGTGVSIFTAQYWGKKDILNIKKIMSIGLSISFIVSLFFISTIMLFPNLYISFFSNDQFVIIAAKEYLIIVSLSFIILSLTIIYSMILRSTENVILPMVAGITGVALNTVLNYLLIFGHFGFPELGVRGAAIATVISRFIELLMILIVTYIKRLPAAINPLKMFSFTFGMFKKYIYTTTPVILQTLGWSLGYSMYSMIYGHIGTISLASYNIACSVERICLIFFTGLGSACAIMVGNKIGEGKEKTAYEYSANFLILSFLLSIVMSFILVFLRSPVSEIYKLSELSKDYISNILLMMAIVMWARALNIVFQMGILKAGGDTLFSMIVDVGGIWLVGVPIAAISGLIFKLPVYLVFLFAAAEEIVKATAAFIRFFSKKWLNNLVKSTYKEEEKNEKEEAALLNES